MKQFILQFIHRGLVACGFGPIILAIVFSILRQTGVVDTLTVEEVCVGIFSLTALAFIAGGMNSIYQIEQLPLMTAILIHGIVLYFGYLATYLVNDWLEAGTVPIIIFSVIFALGYLMIWAVIYFIIRAKTARLNEMLKKKQQA